MVGSRWQCVADGGAVLLGKQLEIARRRVMVSGSGLEMVTPYY